MKFIKTALFLLITAPCFSQVTYTIERIKPDSIFLTETIMADVQGSPRKQEVITSVLITSEANLKKVLEGVIAQGEAAVKEFEQIRNRTEAAVAKAKAAKKALE